MYCNVFRASHLNENQRTTRLKAAYMEVRNPAQRLPRLKSGVLFCKEWQDVVAHFHTARAFVRDHHRTRRCVIVGCLTLPAYQHG